MSRAAKYQKVTEWIYNRIASGELSGGDRLESENEISELFQISRQTVRHAFAILEKEGVIIRVQGSGTYVKEQESSREYPPLSRTVTIITTYADDYIFPRILQAMVRTLGKGGYSSRIMFTNNQVETERSLLEGLLQSGSRDPLIVEPVMSALPNPNISCYTRLEKTGIPILFFHSFYPELDMPHISMNDEQAGRIATEYLIAHGHKKIAGIFKSDDGQGQRRYMGFVKALLHADLPIPERNICWVDTQDMKKFERIYQKLSERLSGCTACVCYNDEVAHELTEYVLAKGIQVPEQMSIISIDNSELARLNAVPLTSVKNPMEALGAKAVESLMKLIEQPESEVSYEFPVELEERCSVAEPADNL